MGFSNLGLSDGVLQAIADVGYTKPTPIQAQAIPVVLAGRDMLGCAQTGTGKTASFTLPMIDILAAGRAKARMPRSLILEPTRELAAQVAENFDLYGKYHRLNKALIIGGESMADQVRVLDRGVDVLIATPGRLLDMFERGRLLMTDVRILVIDEADRMLDMGFIPDVERIASLVSRGRQTLFFSATMPPEIRRLADSFLDRPKEITVAPPATPADTVSQGLVTIETSVAGAGREKRAVLRRLIADESARNGLVFCNRKRDVGILQRSLTRHGISAGMLHGDMVQSARTDVLDRFKRGDVAFLVCSDVAARGLDIPAMSHVFNFDVPTHAEDYVHRIGRTGRAGREGRALTIAAPEDGKYIGAIERLIGKAIPRMSVEGIATLDLDVATPSKRRRRRNNTDRSPNTQADPAPTKRQSGGRGKSPAPEKHAPQNATKHRSKRAAQEDRESTPVVGMGAHVPAFMMRDPLSKIASSKSTDVEDAAANDPKPRRSTS